MIETFMTMILVARTITITKIPVISTTSTYKKAKGLLFVLRVVGFLKNINWTKTSWPSSDELLAYFVRSTDGMVHIGAVRTLVKNSCVDNVYHKVSIHS
jgi:hypothetical protein